MKKIRKFKTDFLFPAPTFLTGIGSVLNLAGNYFKFNYSVGDKEADWKALLSDWGVVGEDILSANLFVEENMKIENSEKNGRRNSKFHAK